MTRSDWIFVAVFYIAGMALLLYGFRSLERLAGCGLFGMVTGFCMVCISVLSIRLEDYR